jgi:hypothetical protein
LKSGASRLPLLRIFSHFYYSSSLLLLYPFRFIKKIAAKTPTIAKKNSKLGFGVVVGAGVGIGVDA